MVRQKQVYSESCRIRSSEVCPDGKAKIQAICGLLQEIAGNHALQLNFDVTQFHNDNLTWVLHRLDLEIEQYTEWRDRVTVQTWPSGSDKLRSTFQIQLF
ncbi:acyl-ACP thioesterase domain-containing protein [Halalkalibaculum sp. DA3122]|uniref:acyl-ACP thioesterase domain-containing protein n=1 Tax=unclassified Halalkalibaculum TaxID=2964617 RepID=UPI003754EAB3